MTNKSKEEELREYVIKKGTPLAIALLDNFPAQKQFLELVQQVKKDALASHQLEMEKKIEGLRKDGSDKTRDRIEKDGYGYLFERLVGYNMAIVDTLSILRGSGQGEI